MKSPWFAIYVVWRAFDLESGHLDLSTACEPWTGYFPFSVSLSTCIMSVGLDCIWVILSRLLDSTFRVVRQSLLDHLWWQETHLCIYLTSTVDISLYSKVVCRAKICILLTLSIIHRRKLEQILFSRVCNNATDIWSHS